MAAAFLGTVRPIPISISNFANQRFNFSFAKHAASSIPRYGFSFFPQKPILQASLHSVPVESTSNSYVTPPGEQSEIIFMGTGTSEGIPRVSCLIDPYKNCQVCKKATEPGNKNKRLNTSLMVRYNGSLGTRNLLIDAGKFFYHSAVRWFPIYG